MVCVLVLLPRVLDWHLVLLRVVVDGAGVGLGGGVTVKLELMAGTATGLTPTGHSSPPHSHPPPSSSSAQWLKMAGLVHSQLVAVVSPRAYTGAAPDNS